MVKYSDSGVDLNKLKDYHAYISKIVSSTYKNTIVGAGHYSGIIDINGVKIALHTDGVGTKTLLASRTGKYETIGIDCVAMNVNDLVSVGAKPMAIVDYIAMEKPMDKELDQLIRGLVKGSKEAETEIVGGETAIMPGVINGFDMACSALGVVNQPKLGNDVKPGDYILGLRSNGIHANGYSLIRKLIDNGKLSLKDWENELMAPTRIYVKEVLGVLDKIKAAAHITGGSFTKLRRITKYGLELHLPEPQEIFKEIEKAGVPHDEMYKVFNMGIGMIIFTSQEYMEDVKNFLEKYDEVFEIGKVIEGSSINIITYKNVILHL